MHFIGLACTKFSRRNETTKITKFSMPLNLVNSKYKTKASSPFAVTLTDTLMSEIGWKSCSEPDDYRKYNVSLKLLSMLVCIKNTALGSVSRQIQHLALPLCSIFIHRCQYLSYYLMHSVRSVQHAI